MKKPWNAMRAVVADWAKRLSRRWHAQTQASHILDALAIMMFVLVFPLSLYNDQNIATIYPVELIPAIVVYLIFGVLLYLVMWLILPNSPTRLLAAVAISYMLLKTFSERYSAISGLLTFIFPEGPFEPLKISIAVISIILVVRILILIVNKYLFSRLNKKNLVGSIRLFLFFVSGWVMLQTFYIIVREWDLINYHQDSSPIENMKSSSNARDIYYLVYDRYPSEESLKENFKSDNSDFTQELKREGFFIRDNAHSNYQYTAPSIASTLDLGYFTEMTNRIGGEKIYSVLPYTNMIRNSRTINSLNASGYESYYATSWWGSTKGLLNAKVAYTPYKIELLNKSYSISEYHIALLNRSFLFNYMQAGIGFLGKNIVRTDFAPDDRRLFIAQKQAIQNLSSVASEKPKFVFAHILNPHPPYVFAADGNTVGYDTGDNDNGLLRRDKMVNQLRYLNTQIIDLIKQIKANSGDNQPIIILQSDEGPYPLVKPTDWTKAEPQTISSKMGVLAAYYMPGVKEDEKPKLDSNVNAFRFVFNNYFNANLEYQSDCQYVFNTNNPYDFTDVTRVLDESKPGCPAK